MGLLLAPYSRRYTRYRMYTSCINVVFVVGMRLEVGREASLGFHWGKSELLGSIFNVARNACDAILSIH